jgi:integrase
MEATNGAYLWRVRPGRSTSITPSPRQATASSDGIADTQRPVPTFADWLKEWLNMCAHRGLRASTVASYRTMIGLHVDDVFGAKRLTEIGGGDLNDLYARMLTQGRRHGSGGLAPRTVRYLHTILNKSLADAVRAGHLAVNPGVAADPPSPRAARAQVFPIWSPAELAQFLESANEDPCYVAFYVAATTGLRRGELLGLRWCDVDHDARVLHVVQAVVEVGHEPRITPPKTERSRRLVALDVRTAELLAEHLEAARARDPDLASESLVFPGADGGPLHPALFSHYFQRRVRQAGLRRIRLHDLRHTHATHALQVGVHPKVVSERLGHSSVTITLDTYSHVLPSMQREAAEAVAALVRK